MYIDYVYFETNISIFIHNELKFNKAYTEINSFLNLVKMNKIWIVPSLHFSD